jgi:alkylated DNA repair dioxygenase AlkB
VPCFGDTILSISLLSRCVMLFTERKSKHQVAVLLEPGSLVVMKGDARYTWTHSNQ